MPSPLLDERVSRWRYVFLGLFAGIIAFSTYVPFIIAATDGNALFHEGEYVGLLWDMRAYYAGQVSFPLIIHGAMDYIPSLIAAAFYGADRALVGTRIINVILVWASWVLFLDLGCLIATRQQGRLASWFAIMAALLFLLTPPMFSESLRMQQSFVAIRDIFLLATTVCFARYLARPAGGVSRGLLATAALCCALGLYWCYDRGIMTLALAGVFCLGLVWQRRLLDVSLFVGTLALAALGVSWTNVMGRLSDNIANILYWVHAAGPIFGRGLTDMNNDGERVLFAMVMLLCALAVVVAIVDRQRTEREWVFFLLGLFALQALLLKSMINLPVWPRILWAFWPSLLVLAYYAGRRLAEGRGMTRDLPTEAVHQIAAAWRVFRFDVPHLYKASTVVFVVLVVTMFQWNGPKWQNYASFLKNLVRPHLNTTVLPADVVQAGNLLRTSGDRCVFLWVNEGVLSLLAEKRNCTRYTYGVYTAPDAEQKMLAQLKLDAPKYIVFDAAGDNAMVTVGRRHMASRLPAVARYIQETYPGRQQIGPYTIAVR